MAFALHFPPPPASRSSEITPLPVDATADELTEYFHSTVLPSCITQSGRMDWHQLTAQLPSFSSLQWLNLQGYDLSTEGATPLIAAALPRLPHLVNLNLKGCRPKTDAFTPSLRHLTALIDLNLSGNQLTVEEINEFVSSASTTVTALNLNLNHLDDESISGLNLSRFALTHLHLGSSWSSHRLGAKGIERFASILPRFMPLVFLNLEHQQFGAEGMNALLPTLSRLPTLTHLDLGYNQLKTEGMRLLASVLPHLTLLTHLSLKWNHLDSSSIGIFAPVSTRLQNLEHLDLSNNPLDPTSMVILAPPLPHLTKLAYLNLQGTYNEAGNIQTLNTALKQLPSLTTILPTSLTVRQTLGFHAHNQDMRETTLMRLLYETLRI